MTITVKLAGLQKLTLLDYPGHTAATVFTPGCNFRCPFCHNADLVLGTSFPTYPVEDFFTFLDKRRGLLDGVCITGGEPLMQADIADFCTHIKEREFKVKLDTNGGFPARLDALMTAGLIDYVAMDVKNTPERYAETVGIPGYDVTPIRESIDILIKGTIPYEFRTTVVRELHSEDDLVKLAQWVEGANAWYLQNFVDAAGVLGGPGSLHAWDPDALHTLLPKLQSIVSATRIRGME